MDMDFTKDNFLKKFSSGLKIIKQFSHIVWLRI